MPVGSGPYCVRKRRSGIKDRPWPERLTLPSRQGTRWKHRCVRIKHTARIMQQYKSDPFRWWSPHVLRCSASNGTSHWLDSMIPKVFSSLNDFMILISQPGNTRARTSCCVTNETCQSRSHLLGTMAPINCHMGKVRYWGILRHKQLQLIRINYCVANWIMVAPVSKLWNFNV